MTVRELAHLWDLYERIEKVCDAHSNYLVLDFIILPLPDDWTGCAATCNYHKERIYLHKALISRRDACEETFLHEVAHGIVMESEQRIRRGLGTHGTHWQDVFSQLLGRPYHCKDRRYHGDLGAQEKLISAE